METTGHSKDVRFGAIAHNLLLSLAGLGAAACLGEADVSLGVDNPVDDSPYVVVADVPATKRTKLDLLFVVDDTRDMAQRQLALGSSFRQLISHLEHTEGGMPDLQVGVISPDMGAGGWGYDGCDLRDGKAGALQLDPACAPTDTPFLHYPASGDADFDLESSFACMAQLGTQGCMYRQPLEAMRIAIDDHPDNHQFVRPDAVLAVVFLTGADDCSAIDPMAFFDPELAAAAGDELFRCYQFGVRCSGDDVDVAPGQRRDCRPNEESLHMTSVSMYAEALRTVKGNDDQIVVAGIMGDPSLVEIEVNLDGVAQVVPACPEQAGGARPAVRLQGLLDEFQHGSQFRSICDGVPNAVLDTAQQIRRALGTACLEGFVADADPDTAGRQPDCIVSDVINVDRIRLPACSAPWAPEASTTWPCFVLKTGLEECGSYPTQLGVQVWRGPAQGFTQPADRRVMVECRVE